MPALELDMLELLGGMPAALGSPAQAMRRAAAAAERSIAHEG